VLEKMNKSVYIYDANIDWNSSHLDTLAHLDTRNPSPADPYAAFFSKGNVFETECRDSAEEAWLTATGGRCELKYKGDLPDFCHQHAYIMLPCRTVLKSMTEQQMLDAYKELDTFLKQDRAIVANRMKPYQAEGFSRIIDIWKNLRLKGFEEQESALNNSARASLQKTYNIAGNNKRITDLETYSKAAAEFKDELSQYRGKEFQASLDAWVQAKSSVQSKLEALANKTKAITGQALSQNKFKELSQLKIEALDLKTELVGMLQESFRISGEAEQRLNAIQSAFSAKIPESSSLLESKTAILGSIEPFATNIHAMKTQSQEMSRKIGQRLNQLYDDLQTRFLIERDIFAASEGQKIGKAAFEALMANRFTRDIEEKSAILNQEPEASSFYKVSYLGTYLAGLDKVFALNAVCGLEILKNDTWKETGCRLLAQRMAKAKIERERLLAQTLDLNVKLISKLGTKLLPAEVETFKASFASLSVEEKILAHDQILKKLSDKAIRP